MALPADVRQAGNRGLRWKACRAVGKSQGRDDRSQGRRRAFIAPSLSDVTDPADRADIETLCDTGTI